MSGNNLFLFKQKVGAMDLEARKYEFIRQLFKVDKPAVMDKLENVLREEQALGRDSIEQYNQDLDAAIAEMEKGEFFTMEEVRKIASKW